MSVSAARPFALDFASQIDGANGMTIGEGQSEFIDNAKDAGSRFNWTAITSVHEATKTYLVINLDYGEGLKKLPQLYGLGDATLKKPEGKLGLKNTGHMAAVCTFKPDSAYYYTDTTEGPAYMCFRFKEYYDAIKAEMGSGRDYNSPTLSPTNYITCNKSRTEDDVEILSRAIDLVKSPELKNQLTNIRSKAAPTHLLQIMVFSDDRSVLISDQIRVATNTYRFYYPKALQAGFNIFLELTNGSSLSVTADEAISPLGSPAFPRIMCACNIRRTGGQVMIQATMTATGQEAAFKFWIGSDCILRPNKVLTWDAATDVGTFDMHLSCISQAEQMEMSKKLGYGVDDMRGVYCEFIDRILGLPFWDGHNYGATKNAGGVRALINFTKHSVAEELFAIQSHKHKTNIKGAHPVVKEFIKKLMRLVIVNYSDYRKNPAGRGQNPGVLAWDINKCYRQLLGIPEPPRPAPPPPSPVPSPSLTGSEDESEEESEEEEEVDSDPENRSLPARPQRPQIPMLSSADQGPVVRLEIGSTVLTFPHDGLYLQYSEIVRKRYQQLGPERGLAYLQAFAKLHQDFASGPGSVPASAPASASASASASA